MKKLLAFLFSCLFLFSGCGGAEQTVPESYMIAGENYFDYQSGLECSAFSTAYVLRHFGEEADGVELFKTFPGKVDSIGAPPSSIVTVFEERGYKAAFRMDGTIEGLKREVSKGVPVIVYIHVEEPSDNYYITHYLPLIGYDEEYFYFAESLPYKANCAAEDLPYNRKTKIEDFEKLWQKVDQIYDGPYFTIEKQEEPPNAS